MATYRRPPNAGPAGPIGKRKSRREMIAAWYAAHDRPAPQSEYDSGVPRRHALTKVPTVTLDQYTVRKRRRLS